MDPGVAHVVLKEPGQGGSFPDLVRNSFSYVLCYTHPSKEFLSRQTFQNTPQFFTDKLHFYIGNG